VEYRNLGPGDYRFELSGSIGNGLWSQEPAFLEISVAPFFWQTQWFRIGSGLLVIGMVAAIARRRERLRTLVKIESLNREKAIDEERARIARDLHDDVGSSLTQMALLSELADSDLFERPEEARSHINEIFNTAKDVTRSLDEIVWAVNPAQDTLERFAAFLGTFVQGYARTAGLTSRIEIPSEIQPIAVASPIRHHLYLATKEVLHNVVKHAGASEIRLCLVTESSGIRLIIEDNGQGILDDPGEPGDGLSNLCKRLQQIGGSITHRPAEGRGTIVEMFAPLRFD
jgi:signal transduction histidine kinase